MGDPGRFQRGSLRRPGGGWALDLATLWEYFRDEVKPIYTGDVRAFFASYVDCPNGGSFSLEDLLADVDGYLCAKRILGPGYRPVSDVVRAIETGEVPRFSTFINERFGGTRANIVAAAVHLFSTPNLLIAAPVMLKSGLPLPNGAELQAVADGFADALLSRV